MLAPLEDEAVSSWNGLRHKSTGCRVLAKILYSFCRMSLRVVASVL